MQRLTTRDEVLATFERFRATPGATFDESHFMDFLLAKPKRRGDVNNSFEGRRRAVGFIEAIQLEYGICFSQADLDRSFSLDAFIDRVAALQASRKGSLASLKNRERADPGWALVVLVDLILVGTAVYFRETPFIAVLLLAVAVLLSGAFAVFANRNKRYFVELRRRIESHGQEKSTDAPRGMGVDGIE